MIGFALETSDAIANATKKLNEKNLDAIVVNIPSTTTGFNTEQWEPMSKLETSRKILEKVSSMI